MILDEPTWSQLVCPFAGSERLKSCASLAGLKSSENSMTIGSLKDNERRGGSVFPANAQGFADEVSLAELMRLPDNGKPWPRGFDAVKERGAREALFRAPHKSSVGLALKTTLDWQ